MEQWEMAADKFIKPWEENMLVTGAIITGSYAAGNQNKYSDIDIHIVLDKTVDWRERGNRIIDGFLIEYFANPVWRIPQYMESDYNSGDRTDTSMFCNGKILFDKYGDVAELKRIAEKEMTRKFKALSENDVQQYKYYIWDEFENLMHLYTTKALDFNFLYYNFLNIIISRYSRFLCADLPSKAKIGKFLADHDFAVKYKIHPFPDEHFSGLFVDALKTNDISRKIDLACTLKEYILNKMGGFDIGSYTLRTSAK